MIVYAFMAGSSVSVGGMFIVSETSVRFLRPARLDDELLVTAKLESGGRASLIIAQQALLKGSGETQIIMTTGE